MSTVMALATDLTLGNHCIVNLDQRVDLCVGKPEELISTIIIYIFFFSFLTHQIDIFFFNFIYLFLYLWLCWVLVSVRGLSPVAASGGHSSSQCAGLSLSRPLLLRSTGCRRAGSVVVTHGPSCSVACGIFPDQGSNPCPLHWQADSQPLHHQGSPRYIFLNLRGNHNSLLKVLHKSKCGGLC